MRLRRAQLDESGTIASIYGRARAEMTYLPQLHTPGEDRAFFAATAKYAEVWVAEDEGRVLGFAVLGAEWLDHLYVEPGSQGRGLGSALFERAKERRAAGFRLWVFQRNDRARSFYERHGCRLVELTDGAANQEREPDALYEWLPPR